MLKPALHPQCYTDEYWIGVEKERIFGRFWLFAGLKQMLSVDQSYVARDFCGVPVVVQNVGGGRLEAFRNACAHRGAPLQLDDFGVRKLICPYHGWTYRADGTLQGIPNGNLYGIDETQKSRISLQRFAVAEIGNFVFINIAADPVPLQEQFPSDLIRTLEAMSAHFDDQVSYTRFTSNYNWKLNVENILDWNHVQFVHNRTFGALLDYGANGICNPYDRSRSLLFGDGRPLQDLHFDLFPPEPARVEPRHLSRMGGLSMPYLKRWYADLLEPPCDIGEHFNCIIFPNLNFGTVHGESFYVQQYMPLAAGVTEYHSWVFTSRRRAGIGPLPHLLWGIHHAEKRVVDEDVVLLEALQRSLKSASSVGNFGDHERLLTRFGSWYAENVQGRHPTAKAPVETREIA